jgi:hypothetical protein
MVKVSSTDDPFLYIILLIISMDMTTNDEYTALINDETKRILLMEIAVMIRKYAIAGGYGRDKVEQIVNYHITKLIKELPPKESIIKLEFNQ